MNSRKQCKVHVLALAGISFFSLVLFLAVYAPARISTQFDDAYMFTRYADNFLAGHGFSWNIEDGPAYGITSPVYLILVTSAKYIAPTPDNSFLLSVLSLATFLLGATIVIWSGSFQRTEKNSNRWHFLFFPLCLLAPMCRYHPFTGMDTTLSFASNALLVLLTVLYVNRPGRLRLILLACGAVLAVQVRPDNGIYALLFPALFLFLSGKEHRKSAVLFILLTCAGCLVSLMLWKEVFGSCLPIPFYAKSGNFLQGYAGTLNWNPVEYLLLFLRDSSPFILIILLFSGRRTIPAIVSVLVPLTATFAFFHHSSQVMGWFSRYYFPSLPFIAFLSFLSLDGRLDRGIRMRHRRLIFGTVSSVLFLAVVFSASIQSSLGKAWSDSQERVCSQEAASGISYSYESCPPPIGWWDCIQYISRLVGSLPPGVRIAATEHGYIAAENLHAHVIDMAGLHDLTLAREGFSAEHILNQDPDLIWMPHTDYVLFRRQLEGSTEFRRNYEYYPGLFNYGIAINLNSALRDSIRSSLTVTVEEAYPGNTLDLYLATSSN